MMIVGSEAHFFNVRQTVGLLLFVVAACSSKDAPMSWDPGTPPISIAAAPAKDTAELDPAFLPPRHNVSGTRVKAVYYQTADGTSELAYWFDTQTTAQCQWVTAEDGKVRCLPLALTPRFFSDAECGRGVIPVSEICGATRQRTSTPKGARVSNFGAPSRPAVVFRKRRFGDLGPGDCREVAVAPMETFVGEGDAVSPDEFVERLPVEIPTKSAGARLVSIVGKTADGGSFWFGLFDTALGRTCSPGLARDGQIRCLPFQYAFPLPQAYFSDRNCTLAPIVAARTLLEPAGTPSLYVKKDERFCRNTTQVYKLVPLVGKVYQTVYQRGQGECVPVDPPSGYRLTVVGDSVPETEFELMETRRGPQRLSPTWYATSGGVVVAGSPLRDTVHGFDCSFMTTSDGATRCLPTRPRARSLPGISPAYFSDASCEELLLQDSYDSCSTGPELRGTKIAGGRCTPVATAMTLPQSSQPFVEIRARSTISDDGTCQSKSDGGSYPGFFRSFGKPIDDSEFQAAVIRMD